MKRFISRRPVHRDWLYTGSIIAIFVCLLTLAGYFWYSIRHKAQGIQQQVQQQVHVQDASNVQGDSEAKWIPYENTQYKFKLELPRHLGKQESRDVPGYTYMVIFTENSLTTGKGAAIAISLKRVNDEVAGTKVAMAKDGEAELVEEKDVTLGGESGKSLRFKPKAASAEATDEPREEKTFIIVHHGNYTYVVSTVPEQVERIVQSFQFL